MIGYIYFLIFNFSIIFFSPLSVASGYEVDLLVGETTNSTPLQSKLVLTENILDGKKIEDDKIQTCIAPHSFAKFNFKYENQESLTFEDLIEIRNQNINEREKNSKWNHITFKIDDKEDISLYWGITDDSVLFLVGESENYIFAPFQRSLPWKNKKTGIVYQKYEVGLLEKK